MLFRRKKPAGPVDYIVAGLGNPGKRYEGTRHNAGFAVLEILADKLNTKVNRVRFKALCGEGQAGDSRVLLMMPQTFMNISGESVVQAMRFYKLPPERVLLLSDDVSLPAGKVRIRRKGSDGGQKGLRSIITMAGSEEFPRIRIGVGEKPHPDYDLAAWVLSRFSKQEEAVMAEAFQNAAEAALLIVQGHIEDALSRYSG